ncbi:MAG: NAD-dependent succinate-semialdehyde dehydrogenase [Alphaproteobacteria bacterium]
MWKFATEANGKAYIAGQWQAAVSAATFAVTNPADGKTIANIPNMGAAETQAAIDSANAAFPEWSAMNGKDRAAILKTWAQLIRDNAEDLGELMTAEQGKPLLEAIGEIMTSADYIDWFAEEGKHVRGEIADAPSQNATVHVTREPVGVVAAITPWNFPAAMVTRKVAPALAAGCPVILKPAEDTPLTALALAELAERAGLPAGVLNIVTGDRTQAPVISKVLMDSPDVQKVSFTGSTEVGKLLIGQSAKTVKRLSMELGGNAPLIVLEDADIDVAVKGVLSAKFMNAGQMCVAPNRIYVHENIYDIFADKLTEAVKDIKVGDGIDPDTQMGPLINQKAVDKVQHQVDDAVSKGAEILCGGHLAQAGTLFFEPTVLKNATADMEIKSQETFGPVAALFRFREEADVITQANDTRYGLAAYVFGKDEAHCADVAKKLQAGMVGINESMLIDEAIPFGGVKESGMGRENSHFGLEEYQEIKSTVIKKKSPRP